MSIQVTPREGTFCRFNLRGMCRFGTRCRNLHVTRLTTLTTPKVEVGNLADNEELESNKENLFGPSTSTVGEAVNLVKRAQSEDKTCGICFDNIMQKMDKTEQIFGILPNCNHCFCFSCISKWRQSKEFELKVAKACPECRVASDFVYRSKYWMDTKEEKDGFIDTHKQRMKKMDCKYFRKGKGKCPFGNTCLYLHALPNGKTLDVGPPQQRRHRPSGLDTDLVHQILFWLNDDDLEDDDDDFDFDLDLSDPCIAMQYYDHGDIRRYMAMDRLMMGGSDDDDDSDYDFLFA
ncbi:hypothetical protein NQ314_004010 [Rhamnusium bicolor]|uniref:RING-type E3 ubiquitin transferase n=1 Tax=Rhamnusium bicolor TaxID=1586634 RepID=A0AAV8ZND8_9CUCU|nr:hypothetical protein NQ314_004010 [Rhamnusium bicolor]